MISLLPVYSALVVINILFIAAGLQYIIRFKKAGGIIQHKKARIFPSVAVAVPALNPEEEVLEKTLSSLKMLNYPKNNVSFYLLDDSAGREGATNKAICQRLGWHYVTSTPGKKSKANALNGFAKTCTEELVAVFDCDEELIDASFFMHTVGFFEDEKIAVVQTKKDCLSENMMEKAATITNSMFFNIVQAVEGEKNSVAFSGSCAIIRKKAMESVGGFPEIAIEDLGISLMLSIKGWKGKFINRLYARGKAVESYGKFTRQQKRYILGAMQMMRFFLPRMNKMDWGEKLRFLTHSLGLVYASLFQLVSIFIIATLASAAQNEFFVASAFGFFILPFMTTLAFAKACGESARATALSYVLNLSIMVERSVQAVLGMLNANYEGSGTGIVFFETALKITFGGMFLWLAYNSSYPENTLLWLFALIFLLPVVFMALYSKHRK